MKIFIFGVKLKLKFSSAHSKELSRRLAITYTNQKSLETKLLFLRDWRRLPDIKYYLYLIQDPNRTN